jgi:hypothetical protein
MMEEMEGMGSIRLPSVGVEGEQRDQEALGVQDQGPPLAREKARRLMMEISMEGMGERVGPLQGTRALSGTATAEEDQVG